MYCRKEYSDAELKSKAEQYCAREEQCISGIRRKLYDWGATASVAEAIIQHLLQQRYIDERRYVHLYCQGKLHIQRWGRNKMIWELRNKGIDNNLIAEGLDSLSDDEYRTTLYKVAQSKLKTLHSRDEYDKRHRLVAYLLSRGFTTTEVNEVLDTLCQQTE